MLRTLPVLASIVGIVGLVELVAAPAAHAGAYFSGGSARLATEGNTFGVDRFGVSVGGEMPFQDSPTLKRDLDAIEDVGARWIRIDIPWSVIQARGPDAHHWSEIDALVKQATARDLEVLGSIAYTPDWARPAGTDDDKHAPDDPDDYADFAAEAVAHYSAMGVHTYEIWNEPNIAGFWAPEADPAAYAELLEAAYPAIKGADPSATVVLGGLAPAATNGTDYGPVDFLEQVYAAGARDSFDAVGTHPYGWPAYPGDDEAWSAWHQMYGTDPSLRSVMRANGDGNKKIWGTEFGAPTNGPPGTYVSESAQAQMIADAYALWRDYSWGGPLFIHEGRDLGTGAGTRENFFGLLRFDYSPKPAYGEYRDAVATVERLGRH